ncbi:MAG TPA: GntR family transcriptional regulator [Candidatus Limnocylindrales bacterium]|jgi:GntR family transcriptional regulator
MDLAYVRVMRRLEADIATGRLTPGERLAPERELRERFDVARNTLRRALVDLEGRGLIESRERFGWFVNGPGVTIETISGPQGLTDWAALHGLAVSSTVCAARIRRADETEARALRIPLDSKVFELERVRIVDSAPLSLDLSVLAPRLIPSLTGLDFSGRSLYQTIRETDLVEPSRAECLLRASSTDERTAELLGLTAGDPILDLTETVFDQYGEPFEYARHLNRGDRYAFRTTVLAGGVWEGAVR